MYLAGDSRQGRPMLRMFASNSTRGRSGFGVPRSVLCIVGYRYSFDVGHGDIPEYRHDTLPQAKALA